MNPCLMPPDERSPRVIRARVQEQKSITYEVLPPLHAAGLHTQRRRRAGGSGRGVVAFEIVVSRPQRALRLHQQHGGRAGM